MKQIISLLVLSTLFLYAQSGSERIEERFKTQTRLMDEIWFEKEKNIEQAFLKLEKKIQTSWDRFEKSTTYDFVTYTPNAKEKTKIQFEKGIIEVEVIEDLNRESIVASDINKTLTSAVNHGIADKDGNGVNYLKNQVSKSALENAKPVRTEYTAPDGVKRVKYSLQVPLVPNHLQKRALEYAPLVMEFSKKYNLDPALIFAIMETESCFNPYADNGIAYGLMQIVPSSGGYDAAKTAFGEKMNIPPYKLKKPEINMDLGCALLYQFYNWKAYFKNYEGKKRDLMAIAGYNCGGTRVANWATKNPAIVSLPNNEFYLELKNFVPHETKGYLTKVPSRHYNYSQLLTTTK